jgi:signal transduction histidine kinase
MRRRLVLAIGGVAALAVLLFAVPLGLVIQRTYRDEELLRLQRDTVAATRAIDLSRSDSDPVELPASPDGLTVYRRDGARVAGRHGPRRADAIVLQALRDGRPAERAADGRLVVAVPLVVREQVRGAVRAERDDAAVMRAARGTWWTLIALAAGVVALAVLAAVVAGRRLARPLERLAVGARRLGHGDFSVRAPRSGVAEVDDVAAALDSAAARLADLVARERAFSADASHQLRTPLAALRIELEAIELSGDSSPDMAPALAQVERLQHTIDTLLAVARDAERSGSVTVLRPLLDDVEARWRGRLAAAGRPLAVHVDPADATARISGPVLSEILEVLLDNAFRHGAGAVEVRVRETSGSLALDVSDEGAGLSSTPDAAFARRSGDGHGIGLALARSLAAAEGARLGVTHAGPQPVFTLLLATADEPVRPREPEMR